MPARLELSRLQIVAFRRRAGSLDERLPAGAASLRRAAWAGLQDSSPRAALLSIHARVSGTKPNSWEHASLVQLWGPRFNDYVVAAQDLAVFGLGRLPPGGAGLRRAIDTAERLRNFLQGRRMPFGEAGRQMGVPPNSLRYAAATGTVVLRWDGARAPEVWTVEPPKVEPAQARRELARRYLNVLGPGTAASFARWAGVGAAAAQTSFQDLARELVAVHSAGGDAWILAGDEPAWTAPPSAVAPARLLPSGDAFYLAWGADRAILVPDARRQAELWTSRVWPGALLVQGEVAGTWRRAGGEVTITPWRRLTRAERTAVEAEAAGLPLPEAAGAMTVRWTAFNA